MIDFVTDQEILAAYHDLARLEGIFAEPASAASIAGVRKEVQNGHIEKGSRIVAVLTGNGLKDPEIALKVAPPVTESIEAEISSLVAALRRNQGRRGKIDG